MATIAEMVVSFGADTSGFSRGVDEVTEKSRGLGGILGGIASQAAGFGVAQVGIGLLGKAFGMAKDAVIGMNSTLETSTLQFETLMGNADDAKTHVADLFEFAKKTPFETGPIIEASKMLRTFGGGALDTMGNLTLLGDAAAATNAPINELGFWTGRLYASLQAGKPFGEASARLSELAVITPQVRQKMEDLQASGASADEIFTVFQQSLGRFGGAMEKQANTWQGVTGTFSDTISILSATAFKPFFLLLSHGLGDINNLLGRDGLVKAVDAFSSAMASGFGLAGSAVKGAARAIMGALQPVADLFSYLDDILLTKVLDPLMRLMHVDLSNFGDADGWGQVFKEAGIAVSFLADLFQNKLAKGISIVQDGITTFKMALSGDWTNTDDILLFHRIIGELGKLIRSVVLPAFADWVSIFTSVWDVLKPFAQFIVGVLTGNILMMIRGFDAIPDALQPVAKLISAIIVYWKDFATVLNPIGSLVMGLVVAFGKGGLSGALEALPTIIRNIAGSFQTVGALIGTFLSEMGPVVLKQLQSVDWGGIGSSLVDLLGDGFSKAKDLGGTLLSAVQSALGAVDWSGVLSGAAGIAGDIVGSIADALGKVAWGTYLSAAGSALIDGLLAAVKATTGFAGDVLSWMGGLFTALDWSGLGGSIVAGFLSGVQAVTSFATDVLSWMVDAFTSVDWTALGGAIVSGFVTGVTAVTSFATDVLTWMVNLFTGTDWSSLGSSIVSGFMTGLNAVTDFGSRAVAWIASTFMSVPWDAVGSALSDGVGAAIAQTQGIASGISAQLAGFDWSGTASSISGALSSGGSSLIDLAGLTSQINTIMPILQPFVDLWKNQLLVALNSFQPTLDNLSKLWAQISTSIGPITPTLTLLAGILGGVLLVAITAVITQMTTFATLVGTTLNTAIVILTGTIQTVGGIILTFQSLVVGLVKIVNDIIHGDWSKAWEDAKAMVQGMYDGIKNIFGGFGVILDLVTGFVGSILGFFQGLYDKLVGHSIIPDLIDGIKTAFLRLPGEVIGVITGFVTDALSSFTTLATDAATKAADLVTGFVGALGDLASKAGEKISAVKTEALRILGELISYIPTEGLKVIQGFVTGIGDAIHFVTEKVGSIKDAITGVFSGAESWLSDIGGKIIGGLVGGITDHIPDVSGALGGITKHIPDWKGPASVDSVLLYPAGQMVMQGFSNGIASQVPALHAQLTEVSSTVKTGFTEIVSQATPDWDALFWDLPGASADSLDAWHSYVQDIQSGGDVLNDWLTHLPAQMQDGAIAIGKTIPQNIAAGVDSGTPALADSVSGLGDMVGDLGSSSIQDALSKVFSLVSSGVDALNKLAAMTQPSSASVMAFTSTVVMLTQSLIDSAATFSKDGLDAAGVFVTAAGPIVSLVSSGVDAFAKLATLVAPSADAVATFKFTLEQLVHSLADSAATFTKDGLDAAGVYVAAAGPIISLLNDGVAAFAALSTLQAPSMEAVAGFKFLLEHLVQSIADSGAMFSKDGLAAAALLVAAAGPIISVLKDGVEAFAGLTLLEAPSMDAVSNFKFLLEHLVRSLADSGAMFSKEGLDAASIFMAAAGPIVAILKDGVDGFSALATMSAPTMDAISTFKFALEFLVRSLEDTGKTFSTDGLSAASTFATAAGPIVSLVTGALASFAALANPDQTYPVNDIVTAFAGKVAILVNAVMTAAATLNTDGVTAASAFANAAGPIVQLITSGLSAFQALASAALTTADQSGITTALVNWVTMAVQAVMDAAKQIDAKGLPAATAFATAGGGILSLITSGVDAFLKLGDAKFAVGLRDATNTFLAMVEGAVRDLMGAALTFDKDGLAAATAYAAVASAVLNVIQGASSFASLKDYGTDLKENLGLFFDDIKLAVGLLIDLGKELDSGLDQAVAIAEKVAKIIDLLTPATSTLATASAGTGAAGQGGGSAITTMDPAGSTSYSGPSGTTATISRPAYDKAATQDYGGTLPTYHNEVSQRQPATIVVHMDSKPIIHAVVSDIQEGQTLDAQMVEDFNG